VIIVQFCHNFIHLVKYIWFVNARADLFVVGDFVLLKFVSLKETMGQRLSDNNEGGRRHRRARNLRGNYQGDVNFAVRDIRGSVTGDVYGPVSDIRGVVNGNIRGVVQGDIYGTINGNLEASSVVLGSIRGVICGNIYGTVNGDIYGRIRGDIVGVVHGTVRGIVEGRILGSVKNVKGIVRNQPMPTSSLGQPTAPVMAYAEPVGPETVPVAVFMPPPPDGKYGGDSNNYGGNVIASAPPMDVYPSAPSAPPNSLCPDKS
jgi:hypothetical protein